MSQSWGSIDFDCEIKLNQVPLCKNNHTMRSTRTTTREDKLRQYNRSPCNQSKGQINLLHNLIVLVTIVSLGLLCYAQETSTANSLDCGYNEFKCKSGQCIPIDRLHNGFKDCYDGSDEDCPNNQHKCLCGLPVCLDKSRVNDGKKDCIDGSDEGHADTNLCRYDTTDLAVDGLDKNAEKNDKIAMPLLVSAVSNESASTSTFTQSSAEVTLVSSSSLPSLSISSPLIAPASTTDDIFVEVTGTFVPYEQLRPFRPAVASSVIALPQYSSIVPAGSGSVIEITGTLLPGAAQESTPTVATSTSTKLLVKTSILSASVTPSTDKDEEAKITTESPFTARNIEQTRFLVTASRAPLSKSTNKVKLYTGFVSINGTKYNLLTVSNGTENTEVTITINEFDDSNGKMRIANRRIKPGEVGVSLNQFGLTINLPSTLSKMISSRDLLLGNADANNNLKYTTILISDANKVKFDQTTGSNGLLLNQDKSRRLDSNERSDYKDELVDLLKLSVAIETSLSSQLKNIVVKQSTAVEVNDAEAKQSSKAKLISHQSGANRKLSEPNEQFVAYGLENSDFNSKIGSNQSPSSVKIEPTASNTPSHVNLRTRTVIDSLNELAIDSEIPASSKYQVTPPLESVNLVSKSVPVYERPTSRLRVDPVNSQTKSSGLIGTTTIFGFIDFTTTINGSLVIFTPNTKQLAAKNDKRKWKSTSSGLIQPTTASSIVASTSSLRMSSILASSINLRENLKLRSRLGSKIRPKIEPTATQPSMVESSESIYKLKSGKYESINFNPVASSKEAKFNSRQSIIQSGLLPSVTYQSVNQSTSSLAFKPTNVQPTGLLSSFTGTISANHSLTEWTTLVIGTYIKGTYAHILESKSRIYPKQELTVEPSNLISFIQSSNKPLLQPSSSSSFSISSSSSVQPATNRISPKPDAIKPSHQITITNGFILPSAPSAVGSSSTTTFNNIDNKPSILEPSSSSSSSSSKSIGLSSSMIEPEIVSSSRQFESTASLDETIQASSSEFSSPYSSSTSALTFTPIRAHVTTYTYFTTYFKDGSMLVSSHKEIVTNTQSATKQTSKIAPTSSSKVLPPVTLYTTYTYYSTLFNGGSQTIKTREETVSHVSKAGEKVTPITINSIVPTQSLSSTQPQSTIQPPSSIPSLTPLSPSSSPVKPETSSTDAVSRKSITPARTYYTTFTYFTTYLRGGSKSIVSRFETITNFVSGENNMDETSSAVVTPSLIKPSAALTRYTTYTFYTTYVRSGSTVVSTSKKTITNVASIPKEIVRPTGSLRNSIKPSKSARTELITFTYFTTMYNQGKPTVSSRFETITSVISQQAFGQRSVSSIKSSSSSTLPSTVVNSNLLSPSVTFDQPFATEKPSLIDSSFANLKAFESSSSLNDVHLSSSKTPELPVLPEVKDMNSIDISSLLAGLKVPITRYTTYTYFTTLGQGISRSTVTRTQVVSNVVTDTIKLSLPSVSSSSSPNLSSSINGKNISSGLQLNRRAPVLDELDVASNENRPQHAHDKPVTFYTTTTHYTTILLPTGGSTILSNIDVRASVTRLSNDQVLPTRHIDPIPTITYDERKFSSQELPRNIGNDEVTTLSSSISPPSRYDYGTNQVEVVSTVNIHRTHETDPLLTYETSLTYLTTYFDQTKPIRTETRRETVTEIRRNTLINPSVTRKPLIIRRTRLRGAAARDISLDPRDGSHLTRKPIVVITKKPTIEPTVILDRPFASDHFPRDFNRHHHPHVDEPGLAPTPVTYYTTFTHFTTELVGGLPVVRSREQVFSTVITDRILPTRTGFGLRPTIGLRAKRSINDGDELIMEESNLDPMAFQIQSGQIVTKMKDNETNDDSMKADYSEEPIEMDNESSPSKTVKPNEEMGTYILISDSASHSIATSLDSTNTSNTFAFAPANASIAPSLSSSSSFPLSSSSSPVSVLVSIPSSPEDPTPSLDSIGVNPSSKVGIISSHVSSVVQNGQTTLYTTQIYGTYIGTIYAHLAKTQSSLLPSSSSSYQIDPALSSLPVGLISESVRSEVNLGTTTLFKTQVHGTFINGVYAHFGQITSNIIAPSVSTNSKIELTQTPISVLISTEINNDITTLHTSEIYSTMISGFSAQFTRATSSVVEPTVSFSGSSTSTRPFIVFPSRKRISNLNSLNVNELVNPSTTSIHTQTVTKTVTATPVVDALLKSQIVEMNLEDQDESEPVDNNNPNKNTIVNNNDDLHETEYYDNRESGSEKVEVGHDEYDSEADEDVHYEDTVEHPNSRTGRSSRRHRPTREKSRFYDYEAPPQPSNNNDDTDYGSNQNSRYNGRYSGYTDPYSAPPVQPVAAPAPIPTPVPVAAPQARYKGVFGQRVGASSRSSSSSSPTSSSFANDYDPYTNYGTSAPITPKSQPALIPHSRGRFAANDQISVNRQDNYPAPQAQTQPTSRPVEVLQPFQNLHETLSDRTYNSNGVTASPGRRPSNRQSSSQSNRRRTSSSSSSRSNSGDLGDTLGVTPRTTPSDRSLVSRYQTPKRSQVEQAQPANVRSSRNRGSNRGQPVTPSYIVNDPPVARAYHTEEPVDDPIEENVYVEPSTRGRNHFAVSSRNRGTGKTRRIILNNPEPSRPPAVVLPPYTPSPSLIFPSSITESPNLSIPEASKTAITITSLVSVIKTLPIRHGFLTSYATITTTAFNRSVINPNEYQLRLNPTNTAETLTIFDSSTIDPTKVREILITTTTLLEVKLVPIRIGFSTRTDTLTDTQVLTTFTTSDKTIHHTVHHAFPGFSFPSSGVHNDPAAAAIAAAAGIVGPAGASPYLPTGLPYPHGGVIGGGGQISFSQVTATITGTTTITSTKVVSLALHGKTLLSTLTLSSTLETTSVTTSLVPVSLAPSLPIFVTTQPPVVTTSLTIHITGDSGDVTELITVLTIPGQVFHTKAIRSIRSTPVQYDHMIPIEKTLAPSML